MARAKGWPHEADKYRQRAIKQAQRILRLGDKVLIQTGAGRSEATMAHLAQIRRWAKAIHIEMLHARETPITWPRGAENARLDAIVACDQMSSLALEAEQAVQRGQREALVLLVSQVQVQAQDVELVLSRVGA